MNSMSFDCVFDSYAWIEYFMGSKKGEKVKEFVEAKRGVTPTIVIAELSAKYHKEKWEFWEEDLQFILTRSVIFDLTLDIASSAGKTKMNMRKERPNFGLADAIILETGKKINAPILTGDPHLKGLANTIFVV